MNLHRDGKSDVRTVHVLVLETFVGPRPTGFHGCHFDGDATNNDLSNLRWASPSDNGIDRTRHGRDHKANRTGCPRGHAYAGRNLAKGSAQRVERKCRACHIARSRVARAARDGVALDFVTTADAIYADLMNRAVA